jgi:tetratricopeptide (TPR) repeat protein
MRTWFAVLALVVALAPARPASADPTTSSPVARKARALVDRGVAAYDRGRFAEAIRLFERAQGLAPSTRLLFNIAQAHAMLGECDDALVYFRRFRDETIAAGQPPPRTLEGHIDRMQACVDRRTEREAASPVAREPDPAEPIDASLEAKRPARGARSVRRTAGWVVVGSGATITAAAAVAGVLALQRQSDLDEVCNDVGMCPENLDDQVAAYQRLRVAAFVSGAVGISALAVGVWLIVTAPSAEARSPARGTTASRVQPWIGPHVLGVSGEF